jgi:hypothetical protein
MSAPSNRQEVPVPHPDWSGQNEIDAAPGKTIAKRARLWRPLRTILEPLACTLARYAHRLIDRTTGIPYSADELMTAALGRISDPGILEKLTIQARNGKAFLFFDFGEGISGRLEPDELSISCTWYLPAQSGTLTVGSGGGNGADDEGKASLYQPDGSLLATQVIGVVDSADPSRTAGVHIGGFTFNDPTYSLSIATPVLTGHRSQYIPDAAGTYGILPNFADAAAANAAVLVGDAWWDTTLKKARVRLS